MKIKRLIEKIKGLSRIQQVVACLFFLSFLWVIGSSAYSMIHQQLIKTMTVGAEYTDVVYSDYGFIQEEASLITAEASGKVDVAVKDGVRVPKNHEVFTVSATDDAGKEKKTHYYAPVSGIVSYHIDGYENMKDMNEIKALDFRSIYEDGVSKDGKSNAGAESVGGEVYAKVIDNLKTTHLYMFYDPSQNTIFGNEGDTFQIRFPELNESTTGTVDKIIDAGDGRKFCRISLGPVSETFLMNRVVQTEVYQVETTTLNVPNDALVYNDGTAGVYIVANGQVQWQAVKVLKENGDYVECENLPEGTVVVLTPKRVEPGDTVKGS